MVFYLNLVFGWIAMISAGMLAIVYLLRVLNKTKKIKWIKTLNRALRKNHKSIGVILIVFGLIHGILSSDKAIGLNFGTLSWIVSILLGLSFVYRKRFNPQKLWMTLHRFLTVAFISILVIHIVDVGGFVIDDFLRGEIPSATLSGNAQAQDIAPIVTQEPIITSSPSPTQQEETQEVPAVSESAAYIVTQSPTAEPTPEPTHQIQSKYIDGVYQATADGFQPGLTVEIEIKDDVIIRVDVIDHNEVKERYWGVPVEEIPKRIVESQSTNVDTISGATYTSRGIINAVNLALEKALR